MRSVMKAGAGALVAMMAAGCASAEPQQASTAQHGSAAQGSAAQAGEALRPPAGVASSMINSDPTVGVRVQQVAPGLRYVFGANVSSNTFVLDTPEGAVVVDTSRPPASRAHLNALKADGVDKVAYIIITHGHGDHTGGVALWKQGDAKVVAHDSLPEFLGYQRMLDGFYSRRNAAQYQFAGGGGAAAPVHQAMMAAAAQQSVFTPDIMFDRELTLDAGGVKLELMHTPGETPDHISVWVPHLKAVFVGDNFYESFPNMYTLRGTRPRWPLDYITSIEKVMALEPEYLLPSHGPPVIGKDEIHRQLKKYRDAIVYVHDAVLAGMNAGKDVHTLMQEIRLPPELDVGEGYGRISWTVRGIYEGYVGWFNGDPSTMFEQGRASVSDSIVSLAGAKPMADEAMKLLGQGKSVEALHLASVGLEGAPDDGDLLRARIAALEALVSASVNRNEMGWLQQGLAESKAKLGR